MEMINDFWNTLTKPIYVVRKEFWLLRILGIKAIAIINFVFYRLGKDETVYNEVTRHERFHVYHWYECFIIFFPIIYVIESIIKGIFGLQYEEISFERECFEHQNDINYIEDRKPYAWVKYIFPFKPIINRRIKKNG